jgi:putative PIN family toxin of toxin-antitoxin system
MIVVIDTSVWISALQFAQRRGTPRLAMEKAAKNDTIAICREIEDEILRVLPMKFKWRAVDVHAAIRLVCPFPLRVEISGALRVCRDPNDDMVLECADLAGAQAIVAGDKDLLTLGSYKQIRILTPLEYLALKE